jgi:two-component system response regulator (stage 0 sporulation protein A)
MRHSIERAWERGSIKAQETYFGYSIDPNTGRPTVSEFVARMAKLCHED